MLILHWRKKRVEKRLGFMADFCPICREIRAFKLIRVGVALAFNEVALGQGKLVGQMEECTQCGLRVWGQPGRQQGFEKDLVLGIEYLIERTFPNLTKVYAQRLRLEEELKRGQLNVSTGDRQQLLMEPFDLLTSMVDEWFAASTTMDVQSSLGCGMTVLLGGGLFFYSCLRLRGAAQDRALIAAGVALGLGIAYTLLQLHLGPSRRVKKKAVPMVAQALRPLKPSRDEIVECLRQCKAEGLKIGKAMKPDDLWLAIQLQGSV